jgi:hypothetical protein
MGSHRGGGRRVDHAERGGRPADSHQCAHRECDRARRCASCLLRRRDRLRVRISVDGQRRRALRGRPDGHEGRPAWRSCRPAAARTGEPAEPRRRSRRGVGCGSQRMARQDRPPVGARRAATTARLCTARRRARPRSGLRGRRPRRPVARGRPGDAARKRARLDVPPIFPVFGGGSIWSGSADVWDGGGRETASLASIPRRSRSPRPYAPAALCPRSRSRSAASGRRCRPARSCGSRRGRSRRRLRVGAGPRPRRLRPGTCAPYAKPFSRAPSARRRAELVGAGATSASVIAPVTKA